MWNSFVAAAWVTAVALLQSSARELTHAFRCGQTKKKKKKDKCDKQIIQHDNNSSPNLRIKHYPHTAFVRAPLLTLPTPCFLFLIVF